MTVGTHLAGAVLTAAILRGSGLALGFPEAVVCLLGSLLADIDTTSSGVGRFARPLSSVLETRFGHRTLTHSLLFCLLLGVLLWPLERVQPSLYWALLCGHLSHLLLDTFNVNGVPLLWPARAQFWFFPARSLRIKYGSPAEGVLAVGLLVSGLGLWVIGDDGFDTTFRRLVASPETAVIDYLKLRNGHEVWAELSGFNAQTQEAMNGRYRIVEALGRSGVLLEDAQGQTYAVSKAGQVVAYRIRAYRGAAVGQAEYRLDLSGRTVGELLTSLPRAQRLHLTGTLELSGTPVIAPPRVGSTARVRRTPRPGLIELHAAQPGDLLPLERMFITSGTAVVRAEYAPGAPIPPWSAPTARAKVRPQTVRLPHLPSSAGLLVRVGDRITQGQVIARYVDDVKLAALERQANDKRREAKQVRAQGRGEERRFRLERAALEGQLSSARARLETLEFLVARDAEPRIKLEDLRSKVTELEGRQTGLLLEYSSAQTTRVQQAEGLEGEAAGLEGQRKQVQERQLVRSPYSGEVAEVRSGEATPQGVTLELTVLVAAP